MQNLKFIITRKQVLCFRLLAVGFRHLNQITGEVGGGRLFALAPISHETVFLLREDWGPVSVGHSPLWQLTAQGRQEAISELLFTKLRFKTFRMKMSLICIKIKSFRTMTRFETEAKSNSELTYWQCFFFPGVCAEKKADCTFCFSSSRHEPTS